MRFRYFLSILFFLSLSASLYGEEVLLVDSLNLIEGCNAFSKEVKPVSRGEANTAKISQKNFKDLSAEFSSARESFYKLEVDASLRLFESIIKSMSNSVVLGGSLDEIHDLFGQTLLYKILIHISKKEMEQARTVYTDYYPIISSFSFDSKKFHPSLKSFLTENQAGIKSTLSYDGETAQILKKAIGTKYSYLFDSSKTTPETIERNNHLLLIDIGNGMTRSLVKNFSKEYDSPLDIGRIGGSYIVLVPTREAFKRASIVPSSERVYCGEGGNMLLLSDGKSLSKEEALSRNMKVEIIPAGDSDNEKRWYNQWWVYAAGGTLTVAILTSIIIINTGDKSSESFRDRVLVK